MSRRPKPAPKVPAKRPEPKVTDLESEIEREIGPLVGQSQREQIILRMTRLVSEQFSGPIAHPRHLAAYEEILPGSAERIVKMAENAQAHNRDMEAKIVATGIWEAKAGMILGFLALMVLIAAGVYAGLHGNNVLAGFCLGAGVLGGAAKLIRGGKSNGKH